jgi:hypothetical protein
MKNKQKKFKWCIDYLLIGYIFQTLLLLIIVASDSNMDDINWWLFMIIPYGIWALEIIKVNLRN